MGSVGANYNFLFGVLRSREARLLSRSRLDTLLSARSFTDAVAQVPPGAFAEQVRLAPNPTGIEAGFRAEIEDLKLLLSKHIPNLGFTRLLSLSWDFHNLKTAVLQKIKSRENEDFFGPEGEVAVAELVAMAGSMTFSGLPQQLSEPFQKAWVAYYEQDKDSQTFELALDRQKQIATIEAAAAISKDMRLHIQRSVDASVAGVILRAYFAKVPWEKVSYGVAEHNDFQRLKSLYPQGLSEWANRVSSLKSDVLQRVFLETKSIEDLSRLLAEERRLSVAEIQGWRLRPPSAEFAYYYVSRMLADNYNIRLVLLSTFNGVPAEDIRKRVNDAFV